MTKTKPENNAEASPQDPLDQESSFGDLFANMDETVRRAKTLGLTERWDTIERTLPHAGRIVLVPANIAFNSAFAESCFAKYERTGMTSEGLKTSLADLPARIANLWFSGYESPDGSVKLGFLRSATISRYGEQDPEKRIAANKARGVSGLEGTATPGRQS